MKKLNLIATLIGFISILNMAYSQSFIADETKLYHATYKGDYTKFDFSLYENYRIGFKDAKNNGKDIKNDRKYKRIDFTHGNIALYSTNVKYRTGNWDGYFPNCDKFYVSNDQLYYDYDIDNSNKLQNPMYYENGRFWNGVVEDTDDPGVLCLRFINRFKKTNYWM